MCPCGHDGRDGSWRMNQRREGKMGKRFRQKKIWTFQLYLDMQGQGQQLRMMCLSRGEGSGTNRLLRKSLCPSAQSCQWSPKTTTSLATQLYHSPWNSAHVVYVIRVTHLLYVVHVLYVVRVVYVRYVVCVIYVLYVTRVLKWCMVFA